MTIIIRVMQVHVWESYQENHSRHMMKISSMKMGELWKMLLYC